MKRQVDYQLGVKRTITTKRGTGTRDQDEVKTTVRTEDFEQLQEIHKGVMSNHKEAVRDARLIAESGGMKEE